MIHPHTELKLINPEMGYGVFATALIPRGTIVYVKDALEIEIDPVQFSALVPTLQQQVERYSYIDGGGCGSSVGIWPSTSTIAATAIP